MKNNGFSLPEIILVTAIIAILTTLVYPHISTYLNTQKEIDERRAQLEIIRGVEAFVEQQGVFPETDTIENFAQNVAPYTNLSENDIIKDSWGKIRYIRKIERSKAYREIDIETNYMFVLSLGAGPETDHGCWGKGADQECDPVVFETYIDDLLQSESDFYELRGDGDGDPDTHSGVMDGDILTPYTDASLKVDQYNETRHRLEAIVAALEEYATIQRYEGIISGEDENAIYFPPSAYYYTESESLYALSDRNKDEFESELEGENVRQSPDSARYEDMRKLMRHIGLPESYCCTPLLRIRDANNKWVESPFYYYSNPKRHIGNGLCHNPQTDLSAYRLPAKVTVKEDVCSVP